MAIHTLSGFAVFPHVLLYISDHLMMLSPCRRKLVGNGQAYNNYDIWVGSNVKRSEP